MALPEATQTEIDVVNQAEMQEAREKALTPVGNQGVSTEVEAIDPVKVLAEMGFTNLKIDFTSFPTLVINKEKIRKSGGDVIDEGEEIELVIMDKRATFLYRGIVDRDTDPELLYSDDKIHANMTGELVTKTTAEWEEKGMDIEVKDYFIIMCKMVGGSLDGEIAQLQIPSTSIGRFDGYLLSLVMAGLNPKAIVTKAFVGAAVGSGLKAFNPWDFKRVK